MASVREFAFQSRLGQWNTIDIYQVATLEEALTKVNELADDLRVELAGMRHSGCEGVERSLRGLDL